MILTEKKQVEKNLKMGEFILQKFHVDWPGIDTGHLQ
jgi:hypothetical protein